MHAAMLACKELDNAGQLSSNLLIITDKEWVKQHIETDTDIEELTNNCVIIKDKYPIKIPDEFSQNHPKANQDLHLYEIQIKDLSTKLIDKSNRLGYLSSKSIGEIPEFKLYQNGSELYVKLALVSNSIRLSHDELNLLQITNKSIFVDMLKFNIEFDFETSLYGGLIVLLNQDDPYDDCQIDWLFIKSLYLNKQDFNTYRKRNPRFDTNNILVRMNATKEMLKNNAIKNQNNRIFSLVKIHENMNPLSDYVKPNAKNFRDHFHNVYQLETNDLDQPLIELKQIETNLNYFSKVNLINESKENQSDKIKEIFIGEHFVVLPFDKKHFQAFTILPAIFHRLNTLIKAVKLKNIIEKSFNLDYKKKNSISTWDNSIKFNKVVQLKKSSSFSDSDSSEIDEYQDRLKLCFRKDSNSNHKEDESLIPDLIIKEYSSGEELEYPSTYAILQCLTLKSANDNFDLERYEILGDCFLKLAAVLRIYTKFSSTNEGNMVLLKSLRVSNKYLYKLALNKNLQFYINSINFQPRLNWILPNQKIDDNDERLKVRFNFKALADSVEALIGCYLMHLGQKGGRALMNWLNFTISAKDDMLDFNQDIILPNPLLVNSLPTNINLSEYEKFADALNYKFNNIAYLYQAFTHPSYIRNRYTASYEKLELVGDAVLDILVTQYIFNDKKEYSPGELTSLRQSLVNNKFFAHLAVKHKFYIHLKYEGQAIYYLLNEYVKMRELCPPDFSYFEIKDNPSKSDQSDLDEYDNETPKFLADIFESVAGAIYLDSNCSLEAVWKVFYPMLKPYLIKFRENPPVSPIVALNLLKPQVCFKFKSEIENGEHIGILTGDDKEFKSKAKTKTASKLKAYKQAVRHYDPDRTIIFF